MSTPYRTESGLSSGATPSIPARLAARTHRPKGPRGKLPLQHAAMLVAQTVHRLLQSSGELKKREPAENTGQGRPSQRREAQRRECTSGNEKAQRHLAGKSGLSPCPGRGCDLREGQEPGRVGSHRGLRGSVVLEEEHWTQNRRRWVQLSALLPTRDISQAGPLPTQTCPVPVQGPVQPRMPESPEQDRLSRKNFLGVRWKLNWQLRGAGRHPSLRLFTLLKRGQEQNPSRNQLRGLETAMWVPGHPTPRAAPSLAPCEGRRTASRASPSTPAPATSFGPDSTRATGPHEAGLPGESWSSLCVTASVLGGPRRLWHLGESTETSPWAPPYCLCEVPDTLKTLPPSLRAHPLPLRYDTLDPGAYHHCIRLN